MADGFTLVELLVVAAILGVVAAVVGLSVAPREGREIDEEIRRLGALFLLAQDQARVSGSTVVWEANLTGYRFRSLDHQSEARKSVADDPLRARAWPFPVTRIRPESIAFGREPLLTPAVIVLTTDKHELRVTLDPMGKVSVLR